MRLFIAAVGAAFSYVALAADAPAALSFHKLFEPLTAGRCIGLEKVRTSGAVIELTEEQFQFVRAFYMGSPPTSKELPPGDKAFIAKSNNPEDGEENVVAGLIDGDQVCAILPAPGWLQIIIDQVGRGETGKRGEAI
jgi:hypothetical protein